MFRLSDHKGTRPDWEKKSSQKPTGKYEKWYSLSQSCSKAAFHALFRWGLMLPVSIAEISFGSAGLWWVVWCGTALSLLTAHLSHFVSDSIHLHGPISSHVAGGWCDSMFIFVLKPRKYTNICSMPNRKAVFFYTLLKKCQAFIAHSHHLFWVNVYHALSHQLHIMRHSTRLSNTWLLWF